MSGKPVLAIQEIPGETMTYEELAKELQEHIHVGFIKQDGISVTCLSIAEYLLESYHIIPKSVKCYEGTLLTGGGDDILVPAFGDLKNDVIDLYFLGQDNEGKYIRIFIEEEK